MTDFVAEALDAPFPSNNDGRSDDTIQSVLQLATVGIDDFKEKSLITLQDARDGVMSAASNVLAKSEEIFGGVKDMHAAGKASHKLEAPTTRKKAALASKKPHVQQSEEKAPAVRSGSLGRIVGLAVAVCVVAVLAAVILRPDAGAAKAAQGKEKGRGFFRSSTATKPDRASKGGKAKVKSGQGGPIVDAGTALVQAQVKASVLVEEMSAAASEMSVAATTSFSDMSVAASSSLLDMSSKASAVASASMSAVHKAVQGEKPEPPKPRKRGILTRFLYRMTHTSMI